MAAHAGEPAWQTGTFICSTCKARVRVQKAKTIPKCPNGHTVFETRVAEPKGERPLKSGPRQKRPARRATRRQTVSGKKTTARKSAGRTARKKAPSGRSRARSGSSTRSHRK